MKLFEYEIRGAGVDITVATSVKKNGTYRLRNVYGIGGDPAGARGSDIHFKKLHELAEKFSQATGDDWELKDLVYIMEPRQYYGRISNGDDDVVYQYITTLAPGSGQQYIFSPLLSSKRITMTDVNPELVAWIIKNRYEPDYQSIRWHDREIMVDLLRQGVTADVMESTLVVMR